MAQGDKSMKKRLQAGKNKLTSSPNKVYASRASKPSGVAALGSTADLSAIAGTYAIPAEPTGAEVDATVQGLADEVEARLDAVEAKLDALIAALKK